MKAWNPILLPLGACLSLVLLARAGDAPARRAGNVPSAEFAVEFSPVVRTPLSPDRRASEPTISRLRTIVGAAEAGLGERLEAVHGLGNDLTRDEIALLFIFLKSPPARNEQALSDLPALKNDILNVLRAQTTPPAGLTDALISIYRHPARDDVMRDYALQHLFVWYEQGAPDMREARAKIREVLTEAAGERSSLAGTALLGLHRLSAIDSEFNHEEINRLALRMVQARDTDIAARITAIQVCAERDVKEALPPIEAVARLTECVPLRLSAAAARDRLGGHDQDRRLRPLAGGPDEIPGTTTQISLRQLQPKEQLE